MQKRLVLFIHGLGGDAKETWGRFPELLREDPEVGQHCAIGFYDFLTSVSPVTLKKTPRIQHIAQGLRTEIENRYHDYDEVLLVGHSLGGLVAKKYLVEELKRDGCQRIGGVLFYATPHNGAMLANIGAKFGFGNEQIKQLCVDSDFIEFVNDDWALLSTKIKFPLKYIVGGNDSIVNERSAKECWGNDNVEVAIKKGHIDIVKPNKPDDIPFLILKNVLKTRLGTLKKTGSHRALWNVPHHRNPFFTGREAELAALHAALKSSSRAGLSQVQGLSGLGGVGKTQTAVEYCYRHGDAYSAVLWVGSDKPETFASSVAVVARELRLPEAEVREQERVVEAVRRWLRENRGWLLVMDNLDDEAMVHAARAFLPTRASGAVLVTTRLNRLVKLGIKDSIRMETLPPEKAAAFLLDRTGKRGSIAVDDVALNSLTEELGYLPLALEQAAAFIAAPPSCSFAEYLEAYRIRGVDVLEAGQVEAAEYHNDSVATTWRMSFERVQQVCPSSADLLRVCAFLAPEAIPFEIVRDGGKEMGENIAKLLEENAPFGVKALLAPLAKYSLLVLDDDKNQFSMHRLVQRVVRKDLDEEKRREIARLAVLSVNAAFPLVKFENWSLCDRLVPHVRAGAGWIEEFRFDLEAAASLLNQGGCYLWARARYAEAEPIFRRALEIREKVLGPEHLDTATSLNNFAGLLQATGRLYEAEPLCRHALAIRENALGQEHADTAQSLNNLAELLRAQGNYSDAESLHQRSLTIREKVFGPEHPLVAASLNNVAYFLYKDEKYSEAEKLCRRVLTIQEKAFGPDHPDVAMALNSLAMLLVEQGKLSDAEPLYRRLLAIHERTLGSEHPHSAIAMENLADLLVKTGRQAEAVALLAQARIILEKSLGKEHPTYASCLNSLANLLNTQGKPYEAEPLYRQALAILEKALGPEHPHSAIGLANLARLLDKTGRPDEAATLLARAKAAREAHERRNRSAGDNKANE